MEFRQRGEEGVQGPMGQRVGSWGKKGQSGVHLSLRLCLSLGLGGAVSPPKPGEPILAPLPPPPEISSTPAPALISPLPSRIHARERASTR